ncbi:hypothetical protein [Erythrobacter aureus]|uniref:Uncharacterized protein n=1 Tax=Erythrobacter aureus TaxID=2182384 RepID=A0A345YJI0_9SPHN|nr:hypothetical protein [Erythrobacter aureus]AXK44082.1 hypothetical protein DVR09_16650 [Erythrobacter aureus]
MSAFFDKFDAKARIGMWAALSAIALVAGWLILSRMASGPLSALMVAAILAAGGVSLQAEAWPSRPPAWANEFIEKWKKMRSRSTKSVAGKFAWNLGRSAIAGICMWLALSEFADVSGVLSKAMIFGFAFSAGFFGVGPSAWAGIVVFFLGHRLALMGLNVDFANPASRAALDRAWAGGGSMSWWWPIGMAAAAPIWILLAFVMKVLSKKLLDEMGEIRAAKEAKKKIDARRARLKQREEEEETDELIEARLAREAAERRVSSIARGKDGSLPQSDGAGGADDEDADEMSAVEKLMEEKNVGQLKRYITQAAALMQSEKDGLDTNTEARRSFDRVVQALDDSELARLRKGDLPGWETLEAYYNKLCGIEQTAMSGGDGDVVTIQREDAEAEGSRWSDDSVVPDVMDEMAAADAAHSPSAAVEEPDLSGGSEEAEEEDEPVGDILSEGNVPAPVHRRASDMNEIENMLASPKQKDSSFREGPDGTPEGEQELPTAGEINDALEGNGTVEENDVTDDPYSSIDRLGDNPDVISEDDDLDGFNEIEGDAAQPKVEADAELGEPVGSFDEPAEVPDEEDGSGDAEADEPTDDFDGLDDYLLEQDSADADADASFGPDGLIEDEEDEAGVETAGTAETASSPEVEEDADVNATAEPAVAGDVAGDETARVAAEDAAPEVEVVEAEAPAWEIKPALAAARIMMGKVDRDLVMKTIGMFKTAEEMGESVGLPAEEIESVFEAYQAKVDGAVEEKKLEAALDAEVLDGVRSGVAALEGMEWEADADLSKRAAVFIEAKEEEARAAEAKRLEEEERKRAEEEAERARLEEERRAEEEKKRREEEAAAQAEKEREEAEAEKARLAELEKDRMKFGIHLLSGQYGDELLSVGGDLFPDVETLATTLGVETYVVEKQFKTFEEKRIAKEKFDALYDAWKSQDLGLVLTLLDDTSDMEAYDDTENAIEDIKSWAESEKRRQEVAGLTEKVDKGNGPRGDDNQKKFIIKRCKTTDEQIDIIENQLPNALSIADSLAKARGAMGAAAPKSFLDEEDKAMMQAARLAAIVVAAERECKEYAMAFFPGDNGASGPKVWERIVKLAERSDGKAPKPTEDSSEGEAEAEAKPKFAQIAPAAHDGPKLRSFEELQKADVKAELAKIEVPVTHELDWYNREYRRKWASEFPDGFNGFQTNDEKGFFDVPVEGGVIRMRTMKSKMPVWAEHRPGHKAGDRVHLMEVEDGKAKFSTLDEAVFKNTVGGYFGGEEKILGVILVAPGISEEGIRTFDRMVKEVRGGPVIILNASLKEDDISAFLKRIKNA